MKALIGSYCLFLTLFVIFTFFFVDKNFFYLKHVYTGIYFYNRPLTSAIFVIFLAGFFLFYFKFLKIGRNLSSKNKKIILGFTFLILVFSFPAILSNDIFNYIFTGKVLFSYKENPYLLMPIEFLGDPLLRFTQAANKIALYGPSWILFSGIPYLFGLNNYILTLINFKVVNLLFMIGSGYCFSKLNSKSSLYLLLNPLFLIEVLVSTHNDISMIFLLLYSFYCVKNRKKWQAWISFILSIGIKYVSVVLLPVFIYTTLTKTKINWERIYKYSFALMFGAFLLSPLREEIYPWYALWFLPFGLLSGSRIIINLSLIFSFSLLARYIPFMLTGSYSGYTQPVKTLITFIPPIVYLSYISLNKWIKYYRS